MASPSLRGCLLDTGLFIAAERGRFDMDKFVGEYPQIPYAMASITVGELLIGAELATPAKRKLREANIEKYLADFAVLDFDIPCARQWAQCAAELRAKGLPIGPNDLLIAATALRHGYGVATFNAREFSRIPNLTVITP